MKLVPPEELVNHYDEWTDEYLEWLMTNPRQIPDSVSRRYAINSIKQQLKLETYAKCAYCESCVEHISYLNVEHIIPKSIAPNLYINWEYLTLSCERCNTHKGAYINVVINPYVHDPSDYFLWAGAMIWPKGGEMAELTIHYLNLNRIELLEMRSEYLKQLLGLITNWSHARDPQLKVKYTEALRFLASGERQYSAMCTAVLAQLQL